MSLLPNHIDLQAVAREPYTVEKVEGAMAFGSHIYNSRWIGPTGKGPWITSGDAPERCKELNAAYAAGQGSRQGVSVEEIMGVVKQWQEADEWLVEGVEDGTYIMATKGLRSRLEKLLTNNVKDNG